MQLKITRRLIPQTLQVWANRITTAPIRFGIDPARLDWQRQAPQSRAAIEAEAQAIKELAAEIQNASWQQQRPLPVIELAANRNVYLLVGDQNDYKVLKAIQNAGRRPVLAQIFTVYKGDVAFLDFDQADEAA